MDRETEETLKYDFPKDYEAEKTPPPHLSFLRDRLSRKSKDYEVEKTPPPHLSFLGDRMSVKPREAQLWSLNQTNSPFLRLPREIRDQIYEYALGGQTIRIGYVTYRSIARPNRVKQMVPVFRYRCTVFSGLVNPFMDHLPARIKTSRGFTLLSNICRQLYIETAPLPFQLNYIAFTSHNIMVNFFMEQHISDEQLNAITVLILPNEVPGPNVLNLLPNLQKVFLAVDQELNNKGWFKVIRRDQEGPKLNPMFTYQG
ncbi:hypothetical protein GQ44DRAFT_709430 [Phaeosphaeriaceae sp. PMI808]|nr:hypothetical protein GQ44DRAFT_709430 [Phaeosphaeriaceae sp. PMI808]